MCRPVEHAYWMLFQPHLGVSPSRPLTEMCEQMHLTVLSVTLLSVTEFSFQRRKTAPLESLERDASVWQQVGPLHSCKCCDTLLCKCQSHPIKWLSDAIAHKGIPPMKFFVCYQLCFPFFTFTDKNVVHRCPCNTFWEREDPWAVTVPCFMQKYPHALSVILLDHVCACYSFASSLDHLHIGYIYNNVSL